MLWRCPACNRQTEEAVCSRCHTPMEAGEPSAATGLLKEIAGSVWFLIAVICFTAAVVVATVSPLFATPPQVDAADVKTAVTAFSDATGTSLNPHALKAISTLFEAGEEETAAVPEMELPLWNILIVVGLWLCVAQGYTNRVNFRKGGPIVLKVGTILGQVFGILVLVCGALLAVGMWFLRSSLVEELAKVENDRVAAALKHLLACEATMWIFLGIAALVAVIGLVYLLFFASATRALNSVLFTAKTGDFGKRAGGLAAVLLCVAFAVNAANAVWSLVAGDLGGIGTALYAVAYLLFAVTLFTLRRRAVRLSWEQPAFSGEPAVPVSHLPTGLTASDLMSDPTAVSAVTPPRSNEMQTPSRSLNEPFAEEALEPKRMTGNGCCPRCGTPIPDNTYFCLNCGQKLE